MRNYLKIWVVYFLFTCLALGCSSFNKRGAHNLKEKPNKVSLEAPVTLKLKGKKGEKYIHDYYVMSVTRTYEDQSIAREKEEITEFKVRQKVLEAKEDKQKYIVEVLEKNGVMDLHDLVMPYVGEKLKIHLSPSGKVLQAEGYEQNSAFYLSPVSLPDEEVRVGDTWALTEEWQNEDSGMPMRIDLVSILKNIYEYKGRRYADIETSGEIQVPALIKQKIGFESTVEGRILLDIQSGNVVWSEIRNSEELDYPSIRIEVKSCMEIKGIKPKEMAWPWAMKPKCNPREDFIYSVPGA